MLYLVATPIGNLSDLSHRAIEVLKDCDYILCEDTRHSLVLLNHWGIQKPLKSFHKFNESSQEESIIQDLKNGQRIALISDAGTPGISDPSHELVQRCQKEKISFTTIPGPCAAIAALTASGFSAERFQFVGFLPKKQEELKAMLLEILDYPGTTICYEAPHRILDTLEVLQPLSTRKICVARELTKMYEESIFGTAEELLHHFKTNPPLGEMVLLISAEEKKEEEPSLTDIEEIQTLQKQFNLSQSDAIKIFAQLRNTPKNKLYNFFHNQKD
jgi:16S rRNA (cytidine1402-2'-O)-methyltransferase